MEEPRECLRLPARKVEKAMLQAIEDFIEFSSSFTNQDLEPSETDIANEIEKSTTERDTLNKILTNIDPYSNDEEYVSYMTHLRRSRTLDFYIVNLNKLETTPHTTEEVINVAKKVRNTLKDATDAMREFRTISK